MSKPYKSVELLGVPSYYQGSHDSLCTYYAAAMFLETLHPEYRDLFGNAARRPRVGLKVEDPLIKNFPHPAGGSNDRVLSTWFYSGAHLNDACKALNKSMKEDGRDTRFKYTRYNNCDKTFNLIVGDINQGLPVMIGWTTIDYGVHCALVVGYRKASLRWFILHDPSGGNEVCWEVLKAIGKSRLTLVTVDHHDGPRPDRMTTVINAKGEYVRPTKIDRWWPHEGKVLYCPIAELYKVAKGDSSDAIQ
jgi:hypothetical protein